MKKKIKKIYEDKKDWFIPAGMFIGLGIGIITGHVAGYLIVGFGVGFLITALLSLRKKK